MMILVGAFAGLSTLAVGVFLVTALSRKVLDMTTELPSKWWHALAWMAYGFGVGLPLYFSVIAVGAAAFFYISGITP